MKKMLAAKISKKYIKNLGVRAHRLVGGPIDGLLAFCRGFGWLGIQWRLVTA